MGDASREDPAGPTRDDRRPEHSGSPVREEAETPDSLERGGPSGTMPLGPAVDDVVDTGPPVPGAAPAREERAGDVPSGGGGARAGRGERAGGGRAEREPLTEWTSDVDDQGEETPGVGSPPG